MSEEGATPAADPPLDHPPVWTGGASPEVPSESPESVGDGPTPLADGSSRRLDPNYVPASKLVGWIVSGFLSLGGATGFLVVHFSAGWEIWAKGALGGGILVLVAFLAWMSQVWPAIEYRRISWRIDARGIQIKRGVVWRHVVNVPRTRIQNTDVTQGPVQRRFGLATLVIHTAGTHEYEVTLEGVSRQTALAIRDELLGEGADDGA